MQIDKHDKTYNSIIVQHLQKVIVRRWSFQDYGNHIVSVSKQLRKKVGIQILHKNIRVDVQSSITFIFISLFIFTLFIVEPLQSITPNISNEIAIEIRITSITPTLMTSFHKIYE